MHTQTVAHPRILLLLLTAALFAGPTAAGQQTDVQQLKDQVAELTKLVQQMRKEHQEQIAELNAQIQALKGRPAPAQQPAPPAEEVQADDEIAQLRALAESLAGPKKKEKPPEEMVYKSRGLSLQQLNPEISASGDLLAYYRDQDGERQRSDVFLRGLELNFQSYLDPFSKLRATVHIHDDGEVHLEEAYYTHFTLIEGATIDLGRFRQQFGTVNRWHEDALDQVQYPLALQRIFGEEGLNQTGASVEWAFPEWAGAHHGLVLQVTNTENEQLFGDETLGTPSLLFHYKNYRDLSRDTYLEFGLSGLFGWNDEWEIQTASTIDTQHDALGTRVFGADLSMLWEPADRALYRNIEWRSELYALNRDILAPDDSGRDTINAWGAYSYLQSMIAQNLIVGTRLDYYEPDGKSYNVSDDGLLPIPLAYPSSNPHRWQVAPYVTWWQSEWVLFRTEYDYAWGSGMDNDEHVVWFQTVFAAGPHKHERY